MKDEVTLEQALELLMEDQPVHVFDENVDDYFFGYKSAINEEAARRRFEREEYEMEHADDAWDDWLGGDPIEHEAEADVSASVPDLR